MSSSDNKLIEVLPDGIGATLELSGNWTILNLDYLENKLSNLDLSAYKNILIDCKHVSDMDLAAAWLLYRSSQAFNKAGIETTFSGFQDDHKEFIDSISEKIDFDRPKHKGNAFSFSLLGKWLAETFASSNQTLIARFNWLRDIVSGLVKLPFKPSAIRWVSIARHIQDTGVNAIGIVALMAFLVAMVLGFQGQSQLSQFGAQIFTVDLVSISILREMGVLLTAILVAGRSGSAFAAEIGVMQLNEEVSAMRTMGVDPFEALVLPRMIALLVTLFLLTFIANIAGLLGMVFIANGMLGVPLSLVIERFLSMDVANHFFVGMVKAPVFAIIIASVGTYRGYYAERSADAVGRNTTNAVVESIFAVIAVDAAFSILFSELGI